jgi:phospholipid/cholesterol/gamma-HCH transport system ATP-binding protein
VVLHKLDLDVYRGEILGFVGGSGTGKSVLMRSILRLIPRQSGVIRILGEDLRQGRRGQEDPGRHAHGRAVPARGAVFGADGAENIQVPMREYLVLPQSLMDELANSRWNWSGSRRMRRTSTPPSFPAA